MSDCLDKDNDHGDDRKLHCCKPCCKCCCWYGIVGLFLFIPLIIHVIDR